MAEATGTEELEVTTPAGKFKARGSDILGIITLCVLCVIAYGGWEHAEAGKQGDNKVAEAIKDQAAAQREMIAALREQNCLQRLTPEEKKRDANIEFCRQLGRGR